MVTMVNFMLCVLYHNFKEKNFNEKVEIHLHDAAIPFLGYTEENCKHTSKQKPINIYS